MLSFVFAKTDTCGIKYNSMGSELPFLGGGVARPPSSQKLCEQALYGIVKRCYNVQISDRGWK